VRLRRTQNGRRRQQTVGKHTLDRREFFDAALGSAITLAAVSQIAAGGAAEQHSGTAVYTEQLQTPIVARHQVVIAGGGPSGVIAALAAARSGADTLLIERYPFLGGNGTAGLMTCYNGFRNQRPPEALQTVKGIPAEYIAELVRLGGIADSDSYPKAEHDTAAGDLPYCIGFDAEAAKVAALNLLNKEGVKVRLHSWVVGPMLSGSQVTGVIVESKSGRQAIAADVVIDATGDGDVAARAGAPFMQPAEKGDRMNMSLMYQLGGVPADAKSIKGIRIGQRVVQWGPRFGGDGLDVENLTRAEVETRLKLWEQVQAMRKRPGQESFYLAKTATGIGVRETRRILGEYVVTEQDAIQGTRFPDVIAISSNPMPSYHGKRFFFNHEGSLPLAGAAEDRRAGAHRAVHFVRAGAVSVGPLDGPRYGHRPRLGLRGGPGGQGQPAAAKPRHQGPAAVAHQPARRTRQAGVA